MHRLYNRWEVKVVPILNDLPDVDGFDESWFKWREILAQEIMMWVRIGSRKTVLEEFEFICDRRGFDDRQRRVLRDLCRYCKLIQKTDLIEYADIAELSA